MARASFNFKKVRTYSRRVGWPIQFSTSRAAIIAVLVIAVIRSPPSPAANPPTAKIAGTVTIQAGTIAKRVDNPHDTDQWEWICGFYPGSRPGEIQSGTSAAFDQARAKFAKAWKIFFANRTVADFQAWRDQRVSTAWKYAMWDGGYKLPTQLPSGRSKCFCGAALTISGVTDHVRAAHAAPA